MKKKIIKYSGKRLILNREQIARYKVLKLEIAKLSQELEPLEECMKNNLKEYMKVNNKKTLKFDGLVASFKPAYVRTMFDSKLLKEDDIDTYNRYTYEQSMSSSLSIKLDV